MMLPSALVSALSVNFDIAITGYLVDVDLRHDDTICGELFVTDQESVQSGGPVTIDQVAHIDLAHPRHIAATETGHHYVLCSYKLSGADQEFMSTLTVHYR